MSHDNYPTKNIDGRKKNAFIISITIKIETDVNLKPR